MRLSGINQIRKVMRSGGYSVGGWMQIPHASIAEILGGAGYDWVAVDMEHGSISLSQLPDLFRALELRGAVPLVRMAHNDERDCKQILDAGAGGIIIPMVNDADQLNKIKNACRWPPSGVRGVGFSRANLFGKYFDEYKFEAQEPLLIAMIEDIRGVKNLKEILEVDGLDAIFIGPYDLSASVGLLGDFEHPDFKVIINEIKSLTIGSGVGLGLHIILPNKEELLQRIDEGYQFIAYSADAIMLRGAAEIKL